MVQNSQSQVLLCIIALSPFPLLFSPFSADEVVSQLLFFAQYQLGDENRYA